MSGISLPVSRPVGRALLVGTPSCRAVPLGTLQRLGYTCAEVDDPYAAAAELARKPLVYRALVLSIASLYREELEVIPSVKRRWPHVEVWLTHTDGRQAALADAVRLGADGLLADDGLHRIAAGEPSAPLQATTEPADARDEEEAGEPTGHHEQAPPPPAPAGAETDADVDPDPMNVEPVLTAEELRALLQEQPTLPPSGDE